MENPEQFTNSSMEQTGVQEESPNAWLPEEFRDGELGRYKDLNALCQGFLDTKHLLSKRAEDFSVQDKQAFLAMREEAYGIPSSPDGYQITTTPIVDENQNLADGCYDNQLNDSDLAFLKVTSGALGLSNEQAQLFYDSLNNYIGSQREQQEQQLEEYGATNGAILADMWGTENVERCLADVETGINVAASVIGCSEDELKRELEYTVSTLACPHVVELFRQLSTLGSRGQGHGLSVGSSRSDAQSQAELLRSTPEWKEAMKHPYSASTQEIQKRMSALVKMANGEY